MSEEIPQKRLRKKNRKLESDASEHLASDDGLDVCPKKVSIHLSDEPTKVETERKQAALGKKWHKVQKTRSYMDKEGYFVNSDYSSFEEVDDVPS